MQSKKKNFGEAEVIRDMSIDYEYTDYWDERMDQVEDEKIELWSDSELGALLDRQMWELEVWEMENDPDYWNWDAIEEYDSDPDEYWDEVEEELNAKADRRESKKETMPMDGRGLITNFRSGGMTPPRKNYKKERRAKDKERWDI
jgi:hypothetical protein